MTRLIMPHLDRTLLDFERLWQTDSRPNLTTWLAKIPPEHVHLAFLELLQIEVCQRLRRGERPAAAEYLALFPDRKAVILSAFGEPASEIADGVPLESSPADGLGPGERISPEISGIRDAFNTTWEFSKSGPQRIASLVAEHRLGPTLTEELARALILIDMGRSWMDWRDWLDANIVHSTVPQLLERRGQLACLSDYLSYLRLSDDFQQVLPELVQAECRCRDAWGDAIGESYYVAKYRVTPTRDKYRPVRSMTVASSGGLRDSTSAALPVQGLTEFGRQHSNEPNPIHLLAGSDYNRIVITDRLNAMVSRRCFSLQLLSPNYAVLTNLSTARRLALGADLSLLPGESAVALFPFSVELNNVQLLFS